MGKKNFIYFLLAVVTVFAVSCKAQLDLKSSKRRVVFPGIPKAYIGNSYQIDLKAENVGIEITDIVLDQKMFHVTSKFKSKKGELFTLIINKGEAPNHDKPNTYSVRISQDNHLMDCMLDKGTPLEKTQQAELVIFYKKGMEKGRVVIKKVQDVKKIMAP